MQSISITPTGGLVLGGTANVGASTYGPGAASHGLIRPPVRRGRAPQGEAIRTALLAYWPLDEASGTRATALGELGAINLGLNDGAIGTNTGPSSILATACAIPGTTGEYLDTAGVDVPGLNLGQYSAWTINVWAKFTTSAGVAGLLGKGVNAGQREWAIDWNTGTPGWEFRYTTDGTTQAVQGFTGPASGVWQMLTVRQDSTTMRLLLNNTGLVEAAAVTPFIGTEEFRVGSWANQFQITADVEALAIWRRHLTDAEVTALYNAGNGRDLELAA